MTSFSDIEIVEMDNLDACSDASRLLFEHSNIWLVETHKYLSHGALVVYCARDKSGLIAALPLIRSDDSLQSIASFYTASTDIIIFNNKRSQDAVAEIFNYLSAQERYTSLLLGPLDQNSLIEKQINNSHRLKRVMANSVNWYSDELSGFEQYYLSLPSALKNTVKRKQKKLEKVHSVSCKMLTAVDDLQLYFAQYVEVYEKSWKGKEASYSFIESVALAAAEQGKLRFGVLKVDEQVVATQLWFIENHTASIFKLAYDPQFRQYSVGSILSMFMSKYVLQQDNVKCIEFGMGDEPYKKDWMSKQRQRSTYKVYNSHRVSGYICLMTDLLRSLMNRVF